MTGKSVKALEEAVWALRNAAELSEWHKRHSSRPFDYQDFCVWVEHWVGAHPIVTQIAAHHDRRVVNGVSSAIATEARRAGTVKQGPVHEGAGPKDIAQNQSAHKRLGDG
jgi:hypothetical protein